VAGLPLIDVLEPESQFDFYILKPFHPGFFRTGLEVLLQRIGVRRPVLTGFGAIGNSCGSGSGRRFGVSRWTGA
jgi:hypothetical protein